MNEFFRNLPGRLIALAIMGWLILQFPDIVEIFVLMFQVIGMYIIRLIEVEPIAFAVGFLIIYGLRRR
jgi:hypothetical protein